ncbi:hypothetical protein IW262DRAFT_534558 [Armillaria fumosa]|nr:hypothetical protein IW262DRAFT_534558 [Armillaria fumosa]
MDFVAEETFSVVPIIKDAVTEGEERLEDREDFALFPSGWGADIQSATMLVYNPSQSFSTTFHTSHRLRFPRCIQYNVPRITAFYITNEVYKTAPKYKAGRRFLPSLRLLRDESCGF